MKATIELGGFQATIENYQWACPEDKALEAMLNGMLSPIGPSGGDPAPNYHAAQAVVEAFGGKIINYELPEYDPEKVY